MAVRMLDIIGCARCPAGRPPLVAQAGIVQCRSCETTWPQGPHGALNTLTDPASSVLHEIDGMRGEHPDRFPTRESFLFQPVRQVSRFADRIRQSEGTAKNYYRSTEANFRYAFERLGITGSEVVLEVGAEHDFPFLGAFLERGCECYATNLFYCYEPDHPPGVGVVLGDMNRLPYRNGVFDVVLLSATSHHSPNLSGLIAELARVTRPGGRVLLLNDPTAGILKHALNWFGMGMPKGGGRHVEINENEYPVSAYRKITRRARLDIVESFFSVYYDQKLRSGDVAGVRFAPLAKLVSLAWKVSWLRTLLSQKALYPGQMLIGLELNMILRKRSR